jgi:putative iron-dependent peroxidase
MELSQAGILADVPRTGRYLLFSLTQPATAGDALRCLVPLVDGRSVVVGVGPALAAALGAQVPRLHEFPVLAGHEVAVPVTPTALCCWLRGEGDADVDAGDLILLTRQLEKALAPTLPLDRVLDAFEAQLRRMVGLDDGITDALFRISKPVSGAYFWCPPLRAGRLDLRALSL